MFRRFISTKYLFVFLLVLTLGLISMPKESEAIAVKIRNPYSQNMTVAVVYFDDSTQQWIVRGWYNVEPKTNKTLNFANAISKDAVWIHAHTSEANWGGSGDTPRHYIVTKEAFKYVAGQAAPAGTNRRKVGFDKWYVDNYGVVNFRP